MSNNEEWTVVSKQSKGRNKTRKPQHIKGNVTSESIMTAVDELSAKYKQLSGMFNAT